MQSKADKPGRAFTGVAEGDWPEVKAYYRFIDHPDEEAVSMEHILGPHRQRTIQRMQGQRTVLCIQDGSDFDYTSLAECEGLGVIGTNQTGDQSRGVDLHTTFAIAPNGLPLGILRAECVAPQLKSPAAQLRHSHRGKGHLQPAGGTARYCRGSGADAGWTGGVKVSSGTGHPVAKPNTRCFGPVARARFNLLAVEQLGGLGPGSIFGLRIAHSLARTSFREASYGVF